MPKRALCLWLPVIAAAFCATPASSAVTIDWVTVGGAGNACDTQATGCFGAVTQTYRIAKTEVTNSQYAGFLNAVAQADPNGLYHTSMALGFAGGITRSGVSGSYSYSAIPGREDKPVNWVSFYNALRFANWLHHHQPTGAQGNSTTEDGAYTITGVGITNNTIVRNAGARFFVPSENEWYKAAFYDVGSASYFDYPAGSNTQTVCAAPTATANRANCHPNPVGDVTDVGSYPGSPSPNGSFDQGANVWEWNEAILSVSFRGVRGGSFSDGPFSLAASSQSIFMPTSQDNIVGFRVASLVPPPFVPVGGVAGAAVAASLVMTGLLGLAYQQGRHGH